jgi:hypothetical protein
MRRRAREKNIGIGSELALAACNFTTEREDEEGEEGVTRVSTSTTELVLNLRTD